MSENNNNPLTPDFMQEVEANDNIPSPAPPEQFDQQQQAAETAPPVPVQPSEPEMTVEQMLNQQTAQPAVSEQPMQVEPTAPIYYQAPQQGGQPQAPIQPTQQPMAPIYYQAPQQGGQAQAPIQPTPQQVAPVYYQAPQQGGQPLQQPIQQEMPVYSQPQQYPQYAAPAEMNQYPVDPNVSAPNWNGTAVKKENKSIMPIIIIIALSLLVLSVVGFLVYRFVLFDPAAHDPKGTLAAAMENTKLDLQSTGITVPSQEKFVDQAISQTFNLTLDSAPDIVEFQPSLAGAKLSMGLQSDLDNRESMLSFGFDSDVEKIPNSKIYFTSDQTIIESDLLYDRPLLINNKTFISDWNASDYGEYSPIYEEGTLKDAIDETFDFFEAADPESISEYEEMFSEFEASLLASETLLNDSMVITHRETKDGRYVFDGIVKGSDVETYIEDVTGVTEDLMYTLMANAPDFTTDDIEYAMSDISDLLDTFRDGLYFEDEISLEFVVDEETKRLIEYRILPTILTADGYSGESEIEIGLETIFSGEEGTVKDIEMKIIAVPMDYPDDEMEIKLNRFSEGGEGKDSVRWEMLTNRTDGDDPEYNEDFTFFSDYTWDQNLANEDNFFLKMGMKSDSYDEEYLVNVRGLLVETADSLSLSEGSFSLVVDNSEQFKVGFDYSCSVIEKGSIVPDFSDGVDFFSVPPEDIVSGLNEQLGGAI